LFNIHSCGCSFQDCLQSLMATHHTQQSFHFHILDSPTLHHLKFDERLKQIKSVINNDPNIFMANWTRINSQDHWKGLQLQSKTGVYLRKPQSFYHDSKSFMVWNSSGKEDLAKVISTTDTKLTCMLYVLSIFRL
jgi:hypothetical protein